MLMQRLAEEFALAVGQAVDIAGPDPLDGEPSPRLHDDFERRAAEPVEQQPAKWLKALVADDPETDQELELTLRLQVGAAGAAVELVLQLRERMLVELRLPQLQHGLDRRNYAVAARFGKQRRIVALRLVGIGAREVDELGPPHVEQAWTGEIIARRDDLVGGLGVGKILGLVDQNDPASHGEPFRVTAAGQKDPRARRAMRARAVMPTAAVSGAAATP